ncbi:F0F1 ATP synthase subunit B [Candidatus Halobeggiatoa sp. HSG11]|nr:F0F1 ATP synthase subunit B [Candidatus Halobeggiatoa sp. HSG11]
MSITVTLFGQMITFAVLVLFVWKYLWGPMTTMMEDRTKRIADGLAASERGKHDLEIAQQRAAQRLREAKQDAADIVNAANKRATEIIEESKQQGKKEGQRQLDAAVSEIEQEINRAKGDLRRHFINLTLDTAKKVLGREVDAAAHNDIMDEMIKKL